MSPAVESERSQSETLAAAAAIAQEAGSRLLGTHEDDVVGRKEDGSVVSDADVRSDAFIRAALADAFPRDEVVSEEDSTMYSGGARVWVVDPLDGSANYVQGLPVWGVSMALVEEGRPVLAVSHFPTMALTFLAERGQGAWEGSRRLVAGDHRDTGANDLVVHCSRTTRRYEFELDVKPRILGCASLSYALVAAGIARASIEATARLWDLAAGWLLVEVAGGVVATLDEERVWPLTAGDYAQRGFATLAAVDRQHFDAMRAALVARL